MSKHTPGKWTVSADENKMGTYHVAEHIGDDIDYDANAARIETCVNVMSGIDDPARFMELAQGLKVKYADEMLEALQRVKVSLSKGGVSMGDFQHIIDVIEKVEGRR